jgi:signal transduction histidine kinase
MSGPTIESLSNRILSIAIDDWNQRMSGALSIGGGTSAWQREFEGLLGDMKALFPEGLGRSIEAKFGGGQERPIDLLEVFTWLLRETGKLGVEGIFRESLNRAISLLSSSGSVSRAIEGSARRQIYQMAYGLTHEINNPLGNIAARAQLLLSRSADSMDRKALGTIVDQTMRAHEMLAELMRVVQPRVVEVGSVDLRVLARSQFDRMASLAAEKKLGWEWIEVQGGVGYLGMVDDRGVMEAIRMVAQNSIEACRHRDMVRWRIERVGEWISIRISDTGPGVGVESARRVFDLYFSGREAGRGLGVSLAAVRRFVEESGGRLGWSSEEGLGAEVTMEFPAAG